MQRGTKHTPEAIEKIRQARLGKKHADDTRVKIMYKMRGNKNARRVPDAVKQRSRRTFAQAMGEKQ